MSAFSWRWILRAILVDDEEGARGHLRTLLAAFPEIIVIGEADHPLDAIERINRDRPELVFLDIQMPLMDGFELLPYLRVQPMIVFCTAYDEYAFKAFETNALDYLLKPVTPERLALSIGRADREWEKLAALESMGPRSGGLRHIVCSRSGATHVIWLRQILGFLKEGRYTAVLTRGDGAFLTTLSLDYLARQITHGDFFRISRSAIVHRENIRRIRPHANGSALIGTNSDQDLRVSRGRFQAFKNWFRAGAEK